MQKENAEGCRKSWKREKLCRDFFLITKPSNESNLFDILPAESLLFPYMKRQQIMVYGLAKGKEEAESMVVSMLEDVYRETGGLCCKEYFETE